MLSSRNRSPALGVLVAALSVAAITAAIFALREVAPVVSTGVTYLLAVLLVSVYWPLWLGLATSIASAVAFNFFHLPPTGELAIAGDQNWVALVVYVVVAVVASTLADSARTRADEAGRRRREADLSAEMARLLLGGASVADSLDGVGARIADAYELRSVSLSLGWVAPDRHQRAIPLLVADRRAATLIVPKALPEPVLEALEQRAVPALEPLVGAALRREQLEAQAIEAHALRRSDVAKTSVLRAVSHDLRSPLTAITTAAGGLRSSTISNSEREELIGIVETEGTRLSRLIGDLLDLSRLEAGAAEPRSDWCSLDEVLRAVAESVPQPPAGFELALERDVPLIRADAAQLERAFANVLENASRFAGERPVTVSAHGTGARVIVRVADQGPGMSRDELVDVFEPFRGSRGRPGGGAGLGLAIARGFVEANGGRLRAESQPGRGATFVFDLPVPRQPALALTAADGHSE